jgi:formylglycine-generating enzyme required for sulfatase activity
MMPFRSLKTLAWIRDSGKVSGCLVAALCFMLLTALPAQTINLMVENTTFTDRNTMDHYGKIRFDISWDNSWRVSEAPVNWDAAWVFAKWKHKNGTEWFHCTLSTADEEHTTPTGSQIDASFTKDNNSNGFFIYRNSNGKGSNDWNGVELRWDYGIGGMADDAAVDVKVFAIEMVYVPQGSFFLGDGASIYAFYDDAKGSTTYDDAEGSSTPAHITDGSVSVNAESYLNGGPIAVDGNDGLSGNAAYPTGYKAFYCMKYEISQGQYADFLNTLRSMQNKNRFENNNGKFRNTIAETAGRHRAGAKELACNYLSVMDGMAYADWAGLRPMTELEFEKACRGPLNSVAGEYAWGNANIASKPYTLKNDGQPDEAVATNYAAAPKGNAAYGRSQHLIRGPLRGGIFATATSTRAEAGATYYGIMEMSGNLDEKPVTLANPAGRRFKGTHGDGALTKDGFADISNWPGYAAGKNSGVAGAGSRGGSWYTNATTLRISGRQKGGFADAYRINTTGFRCVRSAW